MDRVAPGEQTVVAQDHRRPVADVAHQPRALVGVHGDALEVVIRELAVQLRAVEVAHRQPGLRAGHRHAGRGVRVHHAVRAGNAVVDRRVHGEAGRVHRPVGMPDDVPPQVDAHQVRRGHLGVVQAEGVDQEVLVRTGDADRDVVVDQLGPAEHGEDPVAGGQVDPQPPLLGVDARARGRTVVEGLHRDLLKPGTPR